MKIYRIKHKPTGLYVSKNGSWARLSKRGKIYKSKGPLEKWINLRWCSEIKDHDELEWVEYNLEAK